MNTNDRRPRSVTMRALVLSLAGLLTVLSGGLLIIAGGPAQSVPVGGNVDASVSQEDVCVPTEARTEKTGWVTASPGPGWYVVESRTVTDQAGYTDSSGWVTSPPAGVGWVQVDTRVVNGAIVEEGHWQHYSLTGGPITDGSIPPAPPAGSWQENAEQEMHKAKEATWPIPGDGRHYTGEPGRANWFHFGWVDATYQQVTEYLYERTVAPVTHEEFVFAFDHPLVECPDVPTVPPGPPVAPDPPVLGEEAADPEVLGEQATDPDDPAVMGEQAADPPEPPAVEVRGEQATAPKPAVPTAVDAGVSGWTEAQVWGSGLAGGGVLLLVAAAITLAGARRREAA